MPTNQIDKEVNTGIESLVPFRFTLNLSLNLSLEYKQIKKKHLLALFFALIYTTSSAGETLAIKSLNYNDVPLQLPGYTAFMSNQMWIFMIPIYCQMRNNQGKEIVDTTILAKPIITTKDYILQYTGIGILTFAITILRNISVNIMPGSVFALLISTSILFNMIVSWLWLKKTFNRFHILAALLCVLSAIIICISAFLTTQDTMVGANFNLGIPTAIGSAFFIAVMSV
jgi:drug/metabolite transporter (DMT)-like permease